MVGQAVWATGHGACFACLDAHGRQSRSGQGLPGRGEGVLEVLQQLLELTLLGAAETGHSSLRGRVIHADGVGPCGHQVALWQDEAAVRHVDQGAHGAQDIRTQQHGVGQAINHNGAVAQLGAADGEGKVCNTQDLEHTLISSAEDRC